MPPLARPVAERFFAKVARPANDDRTACWEWTAFVMKNGYGKFGMDAGQSPVLAHRWSYEYFRGPIPDLLVIDHLCRNRKCVNPDHLEAVTQQVNLLRGTGVAAIHAAKTHCKNGHEFTPENTTHRADHPGARRCRTCARPRAREAA